MTNLHLRLDLRAELHLEREMRDDTRAGVKVI